MTTNSLVGTFAFISSTYIITIFIYLFIYVPVYIWAMFTFLFGLKKVCKKQSYKSQGTQQPRLTNNGFAN